MSNLPTAEAKLREAIADELRRQAEISDGKLTVRSEGDGGVSVDGTIDLDDLVMVVLGSVAGGP